MDIGANHGLYSYALNRLGLSVEAFEPQPWCVRTIRAWAGERVNVHQVGLSDVEGTLALRMPVVDGTRFTGYATFGAVEGESEVIEVPVRRLDDFGFTAVSFVKVDVEGHEARVLRGGEQTIAACRPTLLVEIEQRHLTDGVSMDRVRAGRGVRLSRGGSARGAVAPADTFSGGDSSSPDWPAMRAPVCRRLSPGRSDQGEPDAGAVRWCRRAA